MTTKLIEVALPLEAISAASRRDKDRKTGTIKNVHKWFAPMPTPAWRALLFAALVDDPGDETGRAELLRLIERLVPDHGGPPDSDTLAEARRLIMEATSGHPPTVFDPFCGGGSTIVEAQRLGLPAVGSDLNPVPVLITRVLTELIPQVAGRPPLVGDPAQLGRLTGGPLDGFLADCRHYAERVRDVVWDKIGHLYPEAPGGGTVVAWLWARTVACPNPACRATAPLASSFCLSKRKGAERWVEPADGKPGEPRRFELRRGPAGDRAQGTVKRNGARCVACGEPISLAYVRAEGQAGRMGAQLMAVAVDRPTGREYVGGDEAGALPTEVDGPVGVIELAMPEQALGFRVQLYGMTSFADLFTNRQLVMMSAFADAVAEVADWVHADGGDAGYGVAVASVLGLCVGKLSMTNSTQARWKIDSRNGLGKAEAAFGRHALPMVWDYTETNPFGGSAGDWLGQLESIAGGLRTLPVPAEPARVFTADVRQAAEQVEPPVVVATDPPYFAQIGYADLSDYFYVWLRRALVSVHPDLFATVATPKADELIAAPYRHEGDKDAATKSFVKGYSDAFGRLAGISHPELPLLIVYAHRQEEASEDGGLRSTAWDAMLAAIMNAGLRIIGTWPLHATSSSRQIALKTNSLASYVVLVCRPQHEGARITDRQGLLSALRVALPKAIRELQEGDISAVDLGQATIGPGMAVFSRFGKVIEPTGRPMGVHEALQLIGQVQLEVLEEFVSDIDAETRWAMAWYREHGFEPGPFGTAEKLFNTVNTSLEGVKRAGIARSLNGKVALLSRNDLPTNWDPGADRYPTVWEVTQHLAKRLERGGGEQDAADLLRHPKVRPWAEAARELAIWLFIVDQLRSPTDALAYDGLVTSWKEIVRLAQRAQQGSIT